MNNEKTEANFLRKYFYNLEKYFEQEWISERDRSLLKRKLENFIMESERILKDYSKYKNNNL